MKKIVGLLLAVLMIASLAACSAQSGDTTETAEAVSVAATTAAQAATEEAKDNDKNDFTDAIITTANVTSNGAIDASDLFSERDLTQNADLTDATEYTVKSGEDITITAAGVYVISGSAENASVIVDAGDEDKVQLVLSGVSVTNDAAPCIYVKNADKVFVTTAKDTENSLTVSGAFSADGDTNTDAVIFSKDDLVLNGLGTLNVNSSDNGISSHDDLKITGGTINITCASDALEANESIAVADGSVTIDTQKDGLHAENDEDDSVGYIYICGGSFKIDADSDGIQGTTIVQIDGGSIDISAREGIEATYVQLNDGTIGISASDDGVNGSNKSGSYTPTIEVNGGSLTIDMGQGDTDAIDVNGNLYINGGNVTITAQSPFDYDGVGELNGGTVVVNGEQVSELTNQAFGGMGGGPGGMGGDMGGNMNGDMGGGTMNGGMNNFHGGMGGY